MVAVVILPAARCQSVRNKVEGSVLCNRLSVKSANETLAVHAHCMSAAVSPNMPLYVWQDQVTSDKGWSTFQVWRSECAPPRLKCTASPSSDTQMLSVRKAFSSFSLFIATLPLFYLIGVWDAFHSVSNYSKYIYIYSLFFYVFDLLLCSFIR